MPQPAEVTATGDDLINLYASVRARLIEAIRGPTSVRQVLNRLDEILDDLDAATRAHVATATPVVYQAGAVATGLGFVWDQASREAVQRLANQNYRELATTVEASGSLTRRALRTLARAGAIDTLSGQTANRAGLTVTNAVQDAAGEVLTVTYRNGAVHSLADWADTAVRTQTALAYNGGALDQFRSHDVEWVEIADGPACGLTSHDDTELANGLVVPLATAQAYPIAHPRCARSLIPRVDITSSAHADEVNAERDPDALRQAAEVERARAARGTVTGRRMRVETEHARVARRQRAGRTASGERPPRRRR